MRRSAGSSRRKGWIGLTLPVEYGGGGRSAFARFVLVEELLAVGAPVSAHWIADRQSGPLILKYGTESQRRFYLPRICRAEAFFCIGMSEPDTGSDLASVRTRATRVEGGWRRQRAQGVDHERAPLALHDRAGSHIRRSAGSSARAVAAHRRPGRARSDDPTDPRPHRRRALQRDRAGGRVRSRRGSARRGRRGLGAGAQRARLRAQRSGAAALGQRAARGMAGVAAAARLGGPAKKRRRSGASSRISWCCARCRSR